MAKLFGDQIPALKNPTQVGDQPRTISIEDLQLHLVLRKITTDFETTLESFFTQWGITTSRFVILNMLMRSESGMTPTETAKQVGVTNATISAILTGLKQSGLIQSVANVGDSRSYKVQLSPEGKELLLKIYPIYDENIGKLWSHFDKEEKIQLTALLTRTSQLLSVMGKKN